MIVMFVENSNVLLSKESAHIMTPRQGGSAAGGGQGGA